MDEFLKEFENPEVPREEQQQQHQQRDVIGVFCWNSSLIKIYLYIAREREIRNKGVHSNFWTGKYSQLLC